LEIRWARAIAISTTNFTMVLLAIVASTMLLSKL
jgi:hypothetical protein